MQWKFTYVSVRRTPHAPPWSRSSTSSMRRSDSGGVPACYVRTYVRVFSGSAASEGDQPGRLCGEGDQPGYVRTYVRGEFIAGGYASCPGPLSLGIPLLLVCPTTTTTSDDDDDNGGRGLVSDLRTVACVRTWRMFPRPYVRTHTLRGSVHACERYVQLNDSCTYVRSWWPLPFWPNAISADFNSRYVRTYALFSLPIIPGLSRSCYSWIETGVETATRSSWVETGVMFVHVVEAVRGSRRR